MKLLDKVVALENEASAFGFRWETTDQIMAQIQSECVEINEHFAHGVANGIERGRLNFVTGNLSF